MYECRPQTGFNNGNSLFEALWHALKCMREKEGDVEGFSEASDLDSLEKVPKNHELMRSCVMAFIKKHVDADIFPLPTETGRSIARLSSILNDIGASDFLQNFTDDDHWDESIPLLGKLPPARIAKKYGLSLDLASAFVEKCRTQQPATDDWSRSSLPPVCISASKIIKKMLNDVKGQGAVQIQDASSSIVRAYQDEHSYLDVKSLSPVTLNAFVLADTANSLSSTGNGQQFCDGRKPRDICRSITISYTNHRVAYQ
jgi:hypothetical protein